MATIPTTEPAAVVMISTEPLLKRAEEFDGQARQLRERAARLEGQAEGLREAAQLIAAQAVPKEQEKEDA